MLQVWILSHGDVCQAMPWPPILPNFPDMTECNTVTVCRQPRHGQYLWKRINIWELEVSLGIHSECWGIDTKCVGTYIKYW